MTKATRITVKTETWTIIRHGEVARGWCPECGAEVDAIPLDGEIATDPGTAARIEEWLAAGKLHTWQPSAGPAHLCLASLLGCLEPPSAETTDRRLKKSFDETRRES